MICAIFTARQEWFMLEGMNKREIKFRAWDVKTQIMYQDVTFSDFDGEYFKPGGDYMGDLNLEFMQYTGLKDKNGREIYEGDVLEASGIVTMREQVTFRDGCFMWGNTGEIDLLAKWAPRSMVIGNIYQNPELCAVPAAGGGE